MPDIDELKIQITSTSEDAVKSIEALKKSLRSLDSALQSKGKGSEDTRIQRVTKSLKDLNAAIFNISNNNVKKITKLADALERLGASAKTVSSVGNVSRNIKKMEQALNQPSNPVPIIGNNSGTAQTTEATNSLRDILSNNSFKKKLTDMKDSLIGDSARKKLADFRDKLKDSFKWANKIVSSFTRVAFYRLIRSTIKMITDGLKLGFDNAYKFSQLVNGKLAAGLDHLATSTLLMKNQLGSMASEVMTSLLPLLERLADKITSAADWLSQLFAALNGNSTYLKAKRVSTTWGEAADNIKAFSGQLLGLDELNMLSSGSGSGKNEPNIAEMFEEAAVSEKLKNLTMDLQIEIKDTLFKWKNLTPEDIARKCISGLGAFLGAKAGFSVAGVPGAIVGTLAGMTLSSVINKVIFDKDKEGKISRTESATLLSGILGGLVGGVVFAPLGLKSALVAASIGATVSVLIAGLSKDSGIVLGDSVTKLSSKKLATVLVDTILPGLVTGSAIFAMSGNLKAALVVATITSGLTLAMQLPKIVKGSDEQVETSKIQSMLKTVLKSAFGAGAITWAATKNVKTSLLAATVTAGLTISLVSPLFDGSKISETEKLAKLNAMLTGVGAGLMTYKYTKSVSGALFAASMSIALTQIISRSDFKNGVSGFDWADTLEVALGAIMGGLIAFTIFKTPNAFLMGASMGVSLTLVLESVGWDWGDVANTISQISGLGSTKGIFADETATAFVTAEKKKDAQKKIAEGVSLYGNTTEYAYDKWRKELKMPDNTPDSVVLAAAKSAGLYASGGYVPGAHLFFANEDGNPEYIGNMGGRTAVANSDQMAYAIEEAAYRGVSRAMAESDSSSTSVRIGFVDDASSKLFKIVQNERESAVRRGAVLI